MNTNPYLNAFLASAYIIGLVSLVEFLFNRGPEGSGAVIIPMMMLSLLVLSVTIMGYLFLLEPLRMFLDGKRREAVTFFLTTVGTFAVLTAVLIVVGVSTLY